MSYGFRFATDVGGVAIGADATSPVFITKLTAPSPTAFAASGAYSGDVQDWGTFSCPRGTPIVFQYNQPEGSVGSTSAENTWDTCPFHSLEYIGNGMWRLYAFRITSTWFSGTQGTSSNIFYIFGLPDTESADTHGLRIYDSDGTTIEFDSGYVPLRIKKHLVVEPVGLGSVYGDASGGQQTWSAMGITKPLIRRSTHMTSNTAAAQYWQMVPATVLLTDGLATRWVSVGSALTKMARHFDPRNTKGTLHSAFFIADGADYD